MTQKTKEKQTYATARHEAGHAVVNWVLRGDTYRADIEMIPRADFVASVCREEPYEVYNLLAGELGDSGQFVAVEEMMVLLGGLAATEQSKRIDRTWLAWKYLVGGKRDIDRAITCAKAGFPGQTELGYERLTCRVARRSMELVREPMVSAAIDAVAAISVSRIGDVVCHEEIVAACRNAWGVAPGRFPISDLGEAWEYRLAESA